jgi:cohesin domain-containing protein
VRHLLAIVMVCFLLAVNLVAHAQEQAVLSLDTNTTSLQTGQEYEITIRIDNAPDFWTTDVALSYDSSLIYIVGTKAGSPIRAGDLFTPDSSVVVENVVQDSQLAYVVSKVGETSPATGNGVIGSFRIYPIASGQTQITFSRVQLVGLTSYDPNAANVGTVPVAAAVVRLDLTINGDPVEPPSEATATPLPTETPTPFAGIGVQVNQQPTVVNVTAAPDVIIPSPSVQEIPVTAGTPSFPLILAFGIMLVGGIGVVVMFVLWRRSHKR